MKVTPARFALLVWLFAAGVYLALSWQAIAPLNTADPDDALRLVQVRDLIAGQAWWDVTQHRINPAAGGGLMHWSRLVDAPIAAGIMLLTPLFGQPMAERIVLAVWPLMLLAPLFVAVALACRRLGDWRLPYIAPLFVATNLIILFQFAPLRIDHHGWQIMLALVAIALVARPADVRSGIWAALACAALVAISLEGLPTLALLAGILALEWIWTGERIAFARLRAFLVALAIAAVAVQGITRGPAGLTQDWCDGLSRPYLAALAVAALSVAGGGLLPARWLGRSAGRLLFMGLCGALAGAALLLVAPGCINGPFAALDPIVDTYWYANVREGRPIWFRIDDFAVFSIIAQVIGLAGCMLALRSFADAARRRAWAIWLLALLGTTLLSLLVIRTASLAQVVATPGCAYLGIRLWQWARSLTSAPQRIFASLACGMAVPSIAGIMVAMPAAHIVPGYKTPEAGHFSSRPCINAEAVQALDAMPPMLLFAPLDIGPHILQRTPHSVLATGHHRNNRIMAVVISGFLATPDRAEVIVRSTGAPMLVACTRAQEFENFLDAPGDSLARHLATGRTPDWLEPVDLGPNTDLKAWRVRSQTRH